MTQRVSRQSELREGNEKGKGVTQVKSSSARTVTGVGKNRETWDRDLRRQVFRLGTRVNAGA